MIIVIDNTGEQKFKMFLPKLLHYLNDRKLEFKVVCGHKDGIPTLQQCLKDYKVRGVILTGSPWMLDRTDVVNYTTNLYCLRHLTSVPILGICFGCQVINQYLGGTLHDLGHVMCQTFEVRDIHGRERENNKHKAKFCCRFLPHRVGKGLRELKHVNIGGSRYTCMFRHTRRPLWGMMFHPEALKKTHYLLDEFCKLYRIL